MYKVLVFGMTENPGGVESFLFNYYRKIDKTKIQFDFLCNTYNKVAYEDELISLGGQVIRIAMRSKKPLKYHRELNEFMKKNATDYQAIWINVCSLANIDYLKVAKKYGIEKRIIHSHNSQNMDTWFRQILHRMNRNKIQNYATDYWACSKDAAKWFYKDELFPKVVIVKNAIELDCVKFSVEKRNLIRNKYGVNGKFVIGNVGRLHFQKNQLFALDIMKYLSKRMPDCMLMFVGQGEDEKKLRRRVEDLNIQDKVIFAGVQSDIGGYLSAFDLFLFPSLFEGLGIAGLEAQANGLPVICSQGVIPEELKVVDNFYFKNLDDGAENWAEKIKMLSKNLSRTDMEKIRKNFTEAGFNIDTEVKRLEQLLTERNLNG